jgi:hypothetical protein
MNDEGKQKSGQMLGAMIDSLGFIRIFGSFKMAINPNKLFIAFAMSAAIALFGLLFDSLSNSVVAISYEDAKLYNNTVIELFEGKDFVTELDIYKFMPDYVDRFLVDKSAQIRRGVFSTAYVHLAENFNTFNIRMLEFNFVGAFAELGKMAIAFDWAIKYHTAYTLMYLLVYVAVMALGGGAICRGAALELCRGNKPSISQNMKYGTKKFCDFLCAPLAPIVLVIIFGSIISLVGFMGNLPWVGEIIMGVSTVLSLLVGLILLMILLGFAGGVHLMLPAVAIEGTDFNDAVSRGYCYTYSRPWLLALYGLVSAFYGAICYLFIRLCAFTLLIVTHSFMAFGIFVDSRSNVGIDKLAALWNKPQLFNLTGKAAAVNIDWTEHFSHLLVSIAVLIISGFVLAFVISFYFSCCTVIYTLCRKAVDKDPIEKIKIEAE